MSEKWKSYYERTKNFPPHSFTVGSVEQLSTTCDLTGLRALDLGCGAGRDTRYLLSRGFVVTAVDADSDALDILKSEFPEHNLEVIQSSFVNFEFAKYEFITSQFALSFSPPRDFYRMFGNLIASLTQGGVLSVNIFGKRDEWSYNSNMTFLEEAQIRKLLEDFELIEFCETEMDSTIADGSPKHWHYFDILARINT